MLFINKLGTLDTSIYILCTAIVESYHYGAFAALHTSTLSGL